MKTVVMVIKSSDVKVALGHQEHQGGGGAHKDKRTKRNRTRGDQKRKNIREWE